MAETAKVYLVGAGPGDPELLTRKAERILSSAAAVIYDRLVGTDILELVNPSAKLIHVEKETGKYAAESQEEAQAEIYGWYLRLRHSEGPVVRLKNGDPMIFSRGGEELEFLARHGFEIEIVPGISAVTAGPALAGIPLTMRGVADTFTVIASHKECIESLDWLVYRHIDTLVILMASEGLSFVASNLIRAGRNKDEPVAILERISTPWEVVSVGTLGAVARGQLGSSNPSVLVIGDVVRLRKSAGTPGISGVFGAHVPVHHKAS